MTTRIAHLALIALIGLCVSCADTKNEQDTQQDAHANHDHAQRPVVFLKKSILANSPLDASDTHMIEQARPFQHVGLYIEGVKPTNLTWRAQDLNGVWSAWQPMTLTWSEGLFHVGRLLLSHPATAIEFKGGDGLDTASAQFYPTWPTNIQTLTRDLPKLEPVQTKRQAIAPANLVTPRSDWGARSPDKICGSVVAPYRMSIHHTAQPDSDGGDPAARMRQMQAYHMDNNGWCDIGYHFVVSQSGKVYQGRADERRPGAHVGNQNAGNVGISFIGNYETSQPPQAQLDAAVSIMKWVKETYDIPWSRNNVKGHKEWPGQSTNCPGQNLLSKVDTLMSDVSNPTPKTYKVDISVKYIGENLKAHHTQGASKSIPDVLKGQSIQAEILVTNNSEEPLRGVQLAYWIEQPFITASTYIIQTDHPVKDKATWVTNDANDEPENPAKDKMGKEGVLNMNAFGAGETKRVFLTLKAQQHSLGAADHPDVRAWIKHIDDVYGEQTKWDQDPTTNKVNKKLQAYDQLDILATDQWQWDVPEMEDTESWTACGDTQLTRELESGLLVATITGEKPCMASSPWTNIKADNWPHMVMRLQTPEGEYTHTLSWTSGETTHLANFTTQSDGAMTPVVLDMSALAGWTGNITQLQFKQGAQTIKLDALFFQGTEGTNSLHEMPEAKEPSVLKDGAGEDPKMDPKMEDPKVDPKMDPELIGNDQNSTNISTGGCASTPTKNPTAPGWMFIALMALGLRRTRHHAKK